MTINTELTKQKLWKRAQENANCITPSPALECKHGPTLPYRTMWHVSILFLRHFFCSSKFPTFARAPLLCVLCDCLCVMYYVLCVCVCFTCVHVHVQGVFGYWRSHVACVCVLCLVDLVCLLVSQTYSF